jgi:hypothetical protein
MRARVIAFVALALSCAGRRESAAPADVRPVPDVSTPVSWADVRAEIDRLVCIKSFTDAEYGPYEVPMYGKREACGLPAASTPLERAVERTFAEAHDVLIAFPDESRAAQQATKLQDPQVRIAAVRDAFFTDRFLAPVLRRLEYRLRDEGLSCTDCSSAPIVDARRVAWSDIAPYLAAYVWPDPVVTPLGADGKPNGRPQYSMHICVGMNGLARLPAIDESLRFAALLSAFHTAALHEEAANALRAALAEPAYAALSTDEARTAYLRDFVGPRVAADPRVRAGICETLARFRADVAVSVDVCDEI